MKQPKMTNKYQYLVHELITQRVDVDMFIRVTEELFGEIQYNSFTKQRRFDTWGKHFSLDIDFLSEWAIETAKEQREYILTMQYLDKVPTNKENLDAFNEYRKKNGMSIII